MHCLISMLFCVSRFRRSNRIFAGLWFGKGKPHFPTFLQPFSNSIRELHYKGRVTHAPAVNIVLINEISYLEDNNIS